MFQLREIEDGRWAVVDTDDVPLFVGSLRQCEDWLDRRENLPSIAEKTPPDSSGWLARLKRLFRKVFSRSHSNRSLVI